MSPKTQDTLVPMGRIVNAFGILGFIKIKTDTAVTSQTLSQYQELYLQINNEWVLYKVEKAFSSDNILNAKLFAVNDRDQALALKGTIVAVSRDKFPKLDNNEYYWVDLIGLNVYNQQQEFLGQVENLMESGGNSVLVVKGDKEHLIPFVNAYVLDVDRTKKQITVDWGLDY